MDRQLLERLIGAGVLVVALVIVVPAILDGDRNSNDDGDTQEKSARSAPVNTATTPGLAKAAAMSTRSMRAYAWVLRSIAT